MTGLIVGVPLRTGIGTELLTIENHSGGLLKWTSVLARRAPVLLSNPLLWFSMVKSSVPMPVRKGTPTMSPVMAVDPVVAAVPRAEALLIR